MGEFIHRDLREGSYVDPGNVRDWMFGSNGGYASYVMKVAEFPPNLQVDRINDGVKFNYLPLVNFHPSFHIEVTPELPQPVIIELDKPARFVSSFLLQVESRARMFFSDSSTVLQ